MCDCSSSSEKGSSQDLNLNKDDSCDCSSNSDKKIGQDSNLKQDDSCDCSSDTDKRNIENSNLKKDEPCDCSSSSSKKGSSRRTSSSSEIICDKRDLRPPFTLVEIQLSKTALNLLSSSSESSTECDCDSADTQLEIIEKITCPDNEKENLDSCDCTTEPSDTLESEKNQSNNQELDKRFEFTLAIIKPEAMMFRKEIEREIIKAGFSICQTRWLQLTPEQVSHFYLDGYEQRRFAQLVVYMSSGPILVMIISKTDAVNEWKLLMGPEKVEMARIYAPDSIRGKYGRAGDDMQNAVHGSECVKSAEREIHFFFPERIVEPIMKSGKHAVDYLWKELNVTLNEGLIKCCEEKPEDPVIWLGNWLLSNSTKNPKCC